MYHESPGSVRNQIGRSLNALREAVEQEDVGRVGNHLRLLIALASPYVEDVDALRPTTILRDGEYDLDGDGDYDDDDTFEACMISLERVLNILAENGLYAWMAPEEGDSEGLTLE